MKSKSVHIISWCILAALAFVLVLAASCHTAKQLQRNHITLDSVMQHDTFYVHQVDSFIRERIVHDTTITVGGGGLQLWMNSDADTVAHANHATLSVRHQGGRQQIDCSCDSQEVVIQNLVRENVYRGYQLDSVIQDRETVSHYVKDSAASLQTILQRESKGFFGRLYGHARNVLALIGLVAVIMCIVHLVKNFWS